MQVSPFWSQGMSQDRVLKVSRLEALTDGIFAIAMTILVLNVSIPQDTTLTTLLYTLHHSVAHKLYIYAGSFIILGTYWVGMDFQHGLLVRISRPYLWLSILFLMFVCVVPFSANLLASYPHASISLSFYAINLALASATQLIMWLYAQTFHLNSDTAQNPHVHRSVLRRIGIAVFCYIISFLIAPWHPNWAFIMLLTPPLIHIIPGAVDKYVNEE
jgi:uncharacterized membrane protein